MNGTTAPVTQILKVECPQCRTEREWVVRVDEWRVVHQCPGYWYLVDQLSWA